MPENDITTSAEARQLVQRIARGYGWISQKARDASDQEALEAIDILQESLGIAVRTLATNLYKSQARFVFELIQNAEDNDYKRAISNGKKPYIKFVVYRDKIVVDSNEDGFTANNVTAICKVGQSTKNRTGAQQYIGEKGIGFKSVFMVASKVHIESGPFSFSFKHPPGAKGMGLVTPEWEPADAALPGPLTRMTLTLLDNLDYPELLSQFDTLPDTFLLFLNKLKAITIDRIDLSGNGAETITFSRTAGDTSREVTLSKAQQRGSGDPQTTLKHYHITRRMLTDLSEDEKRDYNTAEVVLAFPIDGESEPVIGPQQVYAYLPIGDFGFSFLVQSDFVTQASRQDVMESRRNEDILNGIATAFLDAVLQFCNHATLQYKWPRYIPQYIPNPFWVRVKDKIHALLKVHAVLRGRSHGRLRTIGQLKKIPGSFKDESGNALVADLDEEIYLASEYQQQDIVALNCLGLGSLGFYSIIERFQHDLRQPTSRSRFKSPETNDYWHTKTAQFLLQPFEDKSKYLHQGYVRKLPCIPLQDGRWTAITEGMIYFPRTDGFLIPTDLALRIVNESSIANPARKKLFVTLGVKSASAAVVGALILERYITEILTIDFETSLRDLHFLYLTHSPGAIVDLCVSTSLWVFNHRGHRIHDEEDLYFQSDEEYGFQDLMGSVLESAPYSSGTAGSFIHPDYCKRIELFREKRPGSQPTFKAWLQESMGILSHPRLGDPNNTLELSAIFKYIIEIRPEKLLGTLKAYWSFYAAEIKVAQRRVISEAVVQCTNVGPKPLKETFIPSEMLTFRCREFLDVQKFPFLKLENGSNIEEWKFLRQFWVGIEDSLDFWLQVLYYLKLSNVPFHYEIYEVIQRKVWASGDSKKDKDIASDISCDDLICELGAIKKETEPDIKTVQDIYSRLQRMSADLRSEKLKSLLASFETNALIYDVEGQKWAASSACLWSKDAQVPGKSKISGQYEKLKGFFVGILKVKIPDLSLLVKELKQLATSTRSINDIKSLIWQVNAFSPTVEDLNMLHESEVIPVRRTDHTIELRKRWATFSINDRQPWANVFEGKLDYLDFNLKEVRALEPFLSGMEIGGYLSECVIERSSFQGMHQDPSAKKTRSLRRRAYALSRCATHFGSPRAKNDNQAIYKLLLNTKVYETDSIIGSLQHTMNDEIVSVKIKQSKLHIEETLDGLNMYVPKDSKDQEICYLRLLPTKLFNEIMMADLESNSTLAIDPEAVSIIAAIFASSDDVINSILEEAGVAPVAYPDEYEEEVQQSLSVGVLPSPVMNQLRNVEDEIALIGSGTQSGIVTPGAPTPSSPRSRFSNTATSTYQASYRSAFVSQPVYTLSSPPRFDPQPVLPENIPLTFEPGTSDAEYQRLLDNIIIAAKNKGGAFPSQGAFNLDDLLNALPVEAARETNKYDLPFGVRNKNQLAHDMKVGAAGELYAFEILSRLETTLPGFSRINWQSTIRKYVKVHEEYRDMEPWRGAETADITYDDTKNEFTQLLIANGYLDKSIWSHAKPKYFLEVKTTTKECATRLFCSKNQYQRMERMKIGAQPSAEVYIILRVFNLDSDKIDMRLYVDPAGMEERGELQFTSESYYVVPAARDGH